MKRVRRFALLGAGLLFAAAANAQTIDFDDLAVGDILAGQYAPVGVTFSANAFSGPGSSSSGVDWATNTDMTIVSIDTGELGLDYGALGVPSLVAGNILHHFDNWQSLEDGDPSFWILLDEAGVVGQRHLRRNRRHGRRRPTPGSSPTPATPSSARSPGRCRTSWSAS